ncbi:hypothetical protein, partial [Streptosporangium carneum]|uniref:hypothetical protein n=1 Tax=Streptosporangium carneum TaxID=47481 RepID=UPI0034D956C2
MAIMQPMKDFLALMFFKGALVDDPDGILREQGPNSRAAKRLEFTGVEAIRAAEPQLRALVASAIAVEASGAKLPPRVEQVAIQRNVEGAQELHDALADPPFPPGPGGAAHNGRAIGHHRLGIAGRIGDVLGIALRSLGDRGGAEADQDVIGID